MESFLDDNKGEKKGFNYVFLIGIVVGLAAIAVFIGIVALKPPAEDQRAQVLADAHREGSPEFAALTKDVVISTDFDKTVESPTGMGRISMYIVGRIRNKGERQISVLEVNAAVIDQQNNVVKEKNVLVVPERAASLEPGEILPVTLALEGFDPKADRANIRWKVTALKAQ